MKEGTGKMGASGNKVSLKKLESRTPGEAGRRNNKEEREKSKETILKPEY